MRVILEENIGERNVVKYIGISYYIIHLVTLLSKALKMHQLMFFFRIPLQIMFTSSFLTTIVERLGVNRLCQREKSLPRPNYRLELMHKIVYTIMHTHNQSSPAIRNKSWGI